MSNHFGNANSTFELQINYYGTANRRLETGTRNYLLFDGAACSTNEIESAISAPVADLETNLEELLHALLVPVYEQFQFTELPRELVTNVVQDVLETRF